MTNEKLIEAQSAKMTLDTAVSRLAIVERLRYELPIGRRIEIFSQYGDMGFLPEGLERLFMGYLENQVANARKAFEEL